MCLRPTLFAFLVLAACLWAQPARAILTNGESAIDALGQFADDGTTVLYTRGGINDGPGPLGLEGVANNTGLYALIDTTYHRLFVADYGNNRVLVFNLNTDNTLPDKIPDYVLGQADFHSYAAALTQPGLFEPSYLAFDAAHNRLFVADSAHNRVLVFDTSTITNGMNASYVLGQPNFTTSSSATTQAKLSFPQGIAYDATNHRLFVVDYSNDRVLVYNVDPASIANGENASNVLGQADFTHNAAATTQAGMSGAYSVAFDATNNRLFVADYGNHRVLVFNTSTITDGMNAANVLGQANFTTAAAAVTRAGMNFPEDVYYDATNSRLFVADFSNNRVLVFDTSTITDGMNAANVLGQADFTHNTAHTTQAGMTEPNGLGFDATNNRLFVADAGNSRVTIFDTTTITNGENAIDLLGQYTSVTDSSTVSYTKGDPNNGPNELGFYAPSFIALDAVHHRLFVSETSGDRVVVYNLNTDNSISDRTADKVLGQPDRFSRSTFSGQAGMSAPKGLAYDAVNDLLYVVDSGNNRVLVYNTATITDGMNATYELGHVDFTGNSAATTQARENAPRGLALDAANHRLFVADYGNNRVLVYDTSALSNGMNASNVLGQANFTTAATAVTQAGMNAPEGLAYDAAKNRLFVADYSNHRVLVFNTSSITDGMNASNVLGQADFTHNAGALTQAGMNAPYGLSYDTNSNRLFVGQYGANRVTVFNTSSITNGMNAANVLGQTTFTTSSASTTQAKLNTIYGVTYDPGTGRLFVADSGNNHVMIFDASYLGSNFFMMFP